MKGPELYTLENPELRDQTNHIEHKLDLVSDKDPHVVDKNEALKEAQQTLLSENMYKKFLLATLNKDENRNYRGLCEIENIFIATLEDLSDNEIDATIRQFNSNFKRFISEYSGSIKINAEQRRKIFENDSKNNREIRGNIHENSIKSVIQFIRARKKLLDSNPTQQYAFYAESSLDEHYGIDLIECIYGDGGNIDTMNIIQIKSSKPSVEEQAEITTRHKDWISSSLMDLDSFEREYTDGIPENLAIEQLAQNSDEVGNLLLDLCTNPNGFKPENFIEKLNLEELNHKQKAWLLAKYSSILKEKIIEAVAQEMIPQQYADEVLEKLSALENRLRAKARLPRNLSFISAIHSIIAVGPTIIHDEEIASGSEPHHKKKIMKVG